MISRSSSPDGSLKPGPATLRPRLAELLQAMRLDLSYERANGDHLFYRDELGEEVEVLDLAGGFGTLLFGHNHPELIAEAQRLLGSARPVHCQGSHRVLAQRLADQLSQRAGGNYHVVLGNSGAEAVEIALKHVLLRSKARTVLALEGAFHGKTAGALQLTSNPFYRDFAPGDGLRVLRVKPNDLASLEAAFTQAGPDVAALFFEPVLGEGGVVPLTPAFVRRAARLCRRHNAALVADEIQTGLGRTGRFLACESLGVEPDYLVLAKALGGGIAKISACLIKRPLYDPSFDLRHTSTFADDDFSSGIALKALELLDDALLTRIRCQGNSTLRRLREVQDEFPDIIRQVRGAGLMLGVEFRPLDCSPSFLLRFLSSQEDLTKLLAGYFLHAHRIRIVPLLSSPFTLRLQPSALVSEPDLARVIEALRETCSRLRTGDCVGLTTFCRQRPLAPPAPRHARETPRPVVYDRDRFPEPDPDAQIPRVAWLCHLVDTKDFVSIEPDFASVPAREREILLQSWSSQAAPVIMSATTVQSPAGAAVRFHAIMLPVTSSWIKHRLETRELQLPRTLVQQGVDQARELGCQVVSLGQYTSILTANGLRLDGRGMTLTTGNSYATALALEAVHRAALDRRLDPSRSTLAVVGAAGNIGRACAALLGPSFARTILIGPDSPGSDQRLQQLAGRLQGTRTVRSTNLLATRHAEVVVSASNAVLPTLHAAHLRRNAIVRDLSVPPSVHPDLANRRPDLLLIKGGLARLPLAEDLGIRGFPLPPGQVFACMAESMLLGMEDRSDQPLVGAIRTEGVRHLARLARRHQFQLAGYKTESVLDCHHANSPT